jgi:hypothetical protein
MLTGLRTLALAVLALILAPALALACDEETKAAQKACIAPPQACAAAAAAENTERIDRIIPAGTRRPDWEPGHLIERDSMNAVPQPTPEPQTWVKISSRNGRAYSWRYFSKSSKKVKSRVVTAPGSHRG